jgi:4-amino-4-deoxy-L-arabinose transferase-like glycosyltransferase
MREPSVEGKSDSRLWSVQLVDAGRSLPLNILAVLLIAFALRLLVFRAISAYPERFLQPDSDGYHKLAVNLLQSGCFGAPVEHGGWMPEIRRTPGYPAFVAACYAVFGQVPTRTILVQVLISTLTVALAYRLGRLWGDTRTGLLVAVLVSIEVGSIIYASQLMTEALFGCLFLGGVVVWSMMIRNERWQYGLLSGLLLGLGALVRPVLLYFGAWAGVLTLLSYPRGVTKRWRAALSVVLIFAVVVTPWMLRNYAITGQAELSSIQARNLIFYNVVQLRAFQQDISYKEARASVEAEIQRETAGTLQQHPAELTAYYQQKAVSEIRAHWAEYTLVHLKGSLLFFVIPTAGTVARALGWVRTTRTGLLTNLMNRGLLGTWQAFRDFHEQASRTGSDDLWFFGTMGYELLFLFIVNLGAVWGGIRCARAGRWRVLLLAVSVVGYFALVTGPVAYDARYRIPIVPFLALLFASCFSHSTARTPCAG